MAGTCPVIASGTTRALRSITCRERSPGRSRRSSVTMPSLSSAFDAPQGVLGEDVRAARFMGPGRGHHLVQRGAVDPVLQPEVRRAVSDDQDRLSAVPLGDVYEEQPDPLHGLDHALPAGEGLRDATGSLGANLCPRAARVLAVVALPQPGIPDDGNAPTREGHLG